MKRRNIHIILLFLVSFVFLIPYNVIADGTCTYSLDVETLGLSETLKSATFNITVKNDGTVKKGKIKFVNVDGTKEEATLTSGVNLDGKHTLTYKKMFDKNGAFYKAYKKLNNCPSLQFVNQDSYGISAINMVLNGNQSSIDNSNQTNRPDSTDSNSSKRQTYCDKTLNMRNVKKGTVRFLTYETNGVKKFSVILKVNGKEVGRAEDINYNNTGNINYGGDTFNFLVNPDSYKTIWNKSCSNVNTKVYMKADGGHTSTTRVFQTTAPSATENGSYNAAEAKYDTGGVNTFEGKSNLDNLNKEYNSCSQIIDMSEGKFGWILQKLLNYIKIAGPILVVLLSAVDFIKAMASSDENVFKKAQSRLMIRLIAALALFLVPTLVQLLLGLINGISDPTCGLK